MPIAPGPLAGRRILLVEDEYLIAMEMERWLHDAGAVVIGPVPSVDLALDLIDESPPDAAILDVNLGEGQRVFPVADRLDELGVPYLFATGDVRIFEDARYAGHPRLEKPLLNHELLSAAERLIGAPECGVRPGR
jgi:DNA-binding response OmpR family regulator